MDSIKSITVFLYTQPEEPFQVPLNSHFITAEDICRQVASHLRIRPITFHLFGLRVKNNNEVWIPASSKLETELSLEFRLRFKLQLLTNLNRLDEIAFDYLFHQMRHDLINSKMCE